MTIELIRGAQATQALEALRATDPLKAAYEQGLQDGMARVKFFRCEKHREVGAKHSIGPDGPECGICVAEEFAARVLAPMRADILVVARAVKRRRPTASEREAGRRLLKALGGGVEASDDG